MDLYGFNEYQWLEIAIASGVSFFSVCNRIGISDTLDYMRKHGHIDFDD